MVVSVEITSTQIIKPSSPTPAHLRNHKLSLLDQLAPPIHTPLIFFYQTPPTTSNLKALESLKQSLPIVLTRFYPLAGRLCQENNTDIIDCSDSGALLVEANIHANMMDAIKDPTMEELRRYLPILSATNLLLAVQINVFDCGGIAVCAQISHKVADGTSMVQFMNAWAATCRGDDDDVIGSPEFDLADLFPPIDLSIFKQPTGTVPAVEKIVTKRFVFDKEKLANLKLAEHSTRVQAVTAFFWRRFIDLARSKGSEKTISALHAVNLRPRMDPPLPNRAFGNACMSCVAEAGGDGGLVSGLRNALRKIDVKEVQSGHKYLASLNRVAEVGMCGFSSWLRFPLYDVDYGWGRPVWVSTTTVPYKNVVILMGTSSGEGVEAWVNLLEDDATQDFFIC